MADGELFFNGSYYYGNCWLTAEQQLVNCRVVYDYLFSYGWTHNAIVGIIANMIVESTINPGIHQGLDEDWIDGGYGLVQWTKKKKIIDWLEENGYPLTSIEHQCLRIKYELENGLQYDPRLQYQLTFQEFVNSTESADYLARAWVVNYERAEDYETPAKQQERADEVPTVESYLLGYVPSEPTPTPDPTPTPPIIEPVEGTLYEIIYNNYPQVQYSTNAETLNNLVIGGECKVKHSFIKNKRLYGRTVYGTRLTNILGTYIIISVHNLKYVKLQEKETNRIMYIHYNYLMEV